jgi:hypothetical protein
MKIARVRGAANGAQGAGSGGLLNDACDRYRRENDARKHIWVEVMYWSFWRGYLPVCVQLVFALKSVVYFVVAFRAPRADAGLVPNYLLRTTSARRH